jgi:hypothetical protein
MAEAADFPLRYSAHARAVMELRGIADEWVARVARSPERTEPDPAHAGSVLAFGRIPEFGNRLLRVVYQDANGERRVITAFFDRGRARRETAP